MMTFVGCTIIGSLVDAIAQIAFPEVTAEIVIAITAIPVAILINPVTMVTTAIVMVVSSIIVLVVAAVVIPTTIMTTVSALTVV